MRLNILQLISSAGFFGAESVLLELSRELRAGGHSVTVGIFQNLHNPNSELAGMAKGCGLDVKEFRCSGKADLRTVSLISSYVRKKSFDIIHSHGYKSNIYAVLSNLSNKKPLVATCHNWIESSRKMSVYTALDKLFLRRFDAVVPVSATVNEMLSRVVTKKDRLFLIENGIDVGRFAAPGRNRETRDQFFSSPGPVIGTIGRLSAEKGHTYLLKAAQKVLKARGDCSFIIVGDGSLKVELEREARDAGIDGRVVFAGKRTDIPELLSMMDIFVLPSLNEGQPMALIEAMAAGKAIVATDVGDVKKMLKDGALGMVTPPSDPDACARGILRYLDDPAAARRAGEMARKEAVEHHSSQSMAGKYLRVYGTIIK